MYDKDEKELRQAVRHAFKKFLEQPKREPQAIEIEFDGTGQDPEAEKTILGIGLWLFHKKEDIDEYHNHLPRNPGNT